MCSGTSFELVWVFYRFLYEFQRFSSWFRTFPMILRISGALTVEGDLGGWSPKAAGRAPDMVKNEHPLVIWGKLPGGGYVVRTIIFSEIKTEILEIDGTLWRQKMKTVFLSQTDFIQFLTTSPPTQTWAKRFGLVLKTMMKSENLRNFTTFCKLFNPWFRFFLFLESTFHGTCSGQMSFFEKLNFTFFEVALAVD